jgi:hypothetical protein
MSNCAEAEVTTTKKKAVAKTPNAVKPKKKKNGQKKRKTMRTRVIMKAMEATATRIKASKKRHAPKIIMKTRIFSSAPRGLKQLKMAKNEPIRLAMLFGPPLLNTISSKCPTPSNQQRALRTTGALSIRL